MTSVMPMGALGLPGATSPGTTARPLEGAAAPAPAPAPTSTATGGGAGAAGLEQVMQALEQLKTLIAGLTGGAVAGGGPVQLGSEAAAQQLGGGMAGCEMGGGKVKQDTGEKHEKGEKGEKGEKPSGKGGGKA